MSNEERVPEFLFDANVSVISSDDIANVLGVMDGYGISRALVHAGAGKHTSDINRYLARWTHGNPRLDLCWTVDSAENAEQAEHALPDTAFRAVWFRPRAFGHNRPEKLFKLLSEHRIPLFIDYEQIGWFEKKIDWKEVDFICQSYPDLPVIVVRPGLADAYSLYDLWPRHENLCIEISYYQVPNGVGDAVKKFGSERILFGTASPIFEPECPIQQIIHSDISAGAVRKISGGNLARILGVSTSPSNHLSESERGKGADREPELQSSPNSAPLPAPGRGWGRGLAGSMDYPIFDVHGHIGSDKDLYSAATTAEDIIAAMDRCGSERICVSSLEALQDQPEYGHSVLVDAVTRFPDRIWGYAAGYPDDGFNQERELLQRLDHPGMRGIKIHCAWCNVPVEDSRWEYVFRIANEHGLPILAHGNAIGDELKRLCNTHPNATLILAHVAAASYEDASSTVATATELPNLYADTAGSVCRRQALERLVEKYGADHIVFGSDFTYLDMGAQLGRVLGAKISEEARRKIFHDNAVRIFGGK